MHVGEQIRRVMEEKDHSVKWLAGKLCCDRTNIYKIYNKPNIDTDLLQRICVILNYNFFTYISSETSEIMSKN